MKKLKLKDGAGVEPFETVAEIADRTVNAALEQAALKSRAKRLSAEKLPDETYQTLAEAAHKPPEQRDAFSPDYLPEDAGKRLKSFVERLQSLKEDMKALQDDTKEVMREAESAGFEKVVIKDLLKALEMDDDERERRLAMLETYLRGIGKARPWK